MMSYRKASKVCDFFGLSWLLKILHGVFYWLISTLLCSENSGEWNVLLILLRNYNLVVTKFKYFSVQWYVAGQDACFLLCPMCCWHIFNCQFDSWSAELLFLQFYYHFLMWFVFESIIELCNIWIDGCNRKSWSTGQAPGTSRCSKFKC